MNSQNYKIIKQLEGDPTAANEEVEWLEVWWRRCDRLGQLPDSFLAPLALKYRDKDKAPMPDFSHEPKTNVVTKAKPKVKSLKEELVSANG